MPRSSNFFFHAFAFPASPSSSSIGQCPVPGYPPVPISMASSPSALTRSSISSSDNLSYTGSKTPIGIFRSEPLEACAEDAAAELGAASARPEKLSVCATVGIDAASRPVPVAARNSLRSILGDLRGLFMHSPQRWRYCFSPGGIIRRFLQGQLCDSLRFERSKRRNRGRHGEHALWRTLF